MLNRLIVAVVVALVVLTSSGVRADDWPQWLGPDRAGVWGERVVGDTLTDKNVRVRWRMKVAGGYAGPAVAAGRVYVTDYSPPDDPKSKVKTGTERVICFDEKTGEPVWTHTYPVTYGIDYRSGPRATPTVDGDRVYTLGAEGDLFCLDAKTGKPLWSKRFSESGAKTPTWGYAAHPLVDGNKLICLTGPAREGKLVTAFNKMSGDVLWTALKADDIGYCPPTIVQTGLTESAIGPVGPRQLIIWHPESVNSLDPETGKVYWTRPFGPVKYGVSIATPRFIRGGLIGDLLLVSSSWDGAMMLQLDGGRNPSVRWQRAGKGRTTAGGLHVLMAPPAVSATGSHVFGVSNGGELRCLQASTGDVVWETYSATSGEEFSNWSTAFIVPNPTPDHSLLFNEHGDMILARLSHEGYKELGRAKLLAPTNQDAGRPVLWCHPALANGCVFWRNDRELVCFELIP